MQAQDENTLSELDRLGLTYCRLNRLEWDSILGEKPTGFETMPDFPDVGFKLIKRNYLTKHDFTYPAMLAILSIIGEANASRYWWKFELRRDEKEWFKWYCNEKMMGTEAFLRREELLKNPTQKYPERIGQKCTTYNGKKGKSPVVSKLFATISNLLQMIVQVFKSSRS